ncbi:MULTISPECIES: alcohol dehydrogenase catalytic domain-containing protein [unclassified Rhizobium]|jgi:threonine dehydrogenase-like Zn-dependent dehydrogenase|uniref:zinc-dependent alcohol dehydrogenase n=1 Tax=unclassified Rhizobium TaxID=2613769 RepID=UPI0006490DA4|nr:MULTISPECIES: alcohol dehydrogenase catalytic domain-containing protein [unclassified Rhizobium]OJY72095.1 MAG: dehydrogenase [Rhizobium sp. 60-20]RKD36054.1 (R,R)-butanediol dehydrogenase/meso-butanediol dehydrogenase/diacetyl reductase [Rhizobium sp. WW_1]
MKAVRLHDALDLRVEDVGDPGPPPAGYATVDVRAAGICGSDLHNFRTGQWISRRPSTAGHEFCGRVAAVGDDVEDLKVGDLVAVDSRFYCGRCEACLSGHSNVCDHLGFVGEVCDGGFAERANLPARLLHKHDPSLDPATAAMAEPLAVALHAVRRLRPSPGEPVLLIGCGTIGGLCGLLLSHLHDGKLLFCDLNLDRATMVARICGGSAIDLNKLQAKAALDGARLRYAVDATGSIAAIKKGLEILDGGGALALVGISHGTIELDPNLFVEREISLIGCHAFEGELTDAIALLPRLQSSLLQFSEVLASLDEIPDAYRRLIDGRSNKLKTIIRVAD